VSPPATLPGSLGPAMTPAPPPAPKPAAKPEAPKTEPVAKPEPPRDPRVEAQSAVESLLRRYEAAWEALDFNALRQVWITAPPAVESRMRRMREYAMDVSGCLGKAITLAPDVRSATATCRVGFEFREVGGRQQETAMQTFTFEKRGDNWFITGLR
jgi:hypothetical protein